MKKLFYYLLIATSISAINISCKDDNVTPPAEEEEGNGNNTDTDTDNGDNNNNTNDGTYIAIKPNWPDD